MLSRGGPGGGIIRTTPGLVRARSLNFDDRKRQREGEAIRNTHHLCTKDCDERRVQGCPSAALAISVREGGKRFAQLMHQQQPYDFY